MMQPTDSERREKLLTILSVCCGRVQVDSTVSLLEVQYTSEQCMDSFCFMHDVEMILDSLGVQTETCVATCGERTAYAVAISSTAGLFKKLVELVNRCREEVECVCVYRSDSLDLWGTVYKTPTGEIAIHLTEESL